MFLYSRKKQDYTWKKKTTVSSTNPIRTVRELIFKLSQLLEARFPYVWIKGEVTNCTLASSGHIYFSLKDEQELLNCVWFKRYHQDLAFDPLTGECFENGKKPSLAQSLRDGQEIICAGKLAVYGARGQYQLIVEHALENGIGQLHEAFEKLKQKLSSEGLFDMKHKKPIPRKLQNIALITAPTGAVIHDFLRIAQTRGIKSTIHIFPSLVQGDEAPNKLISALQKAENHIFPNGKKADCIVFIRGGGSIQDLWAFNSEELARAIFACSIPIVTGIGHEPDFSIADYVSDLSCATPSHAAQFLWKDKNSLIQETDDLEYAMRSSFLALLKHHEKELSFLKRQLELISPKNKLNEKSYHLMTVSQRLQKALQILFQNKQTKLYIAKQKIKRHEPGFTVLFHSILQLNKEINRYARTTIKEKEEKLHKLQKQLRQNFTAYLQDKEFLLQSKALVLEGNNPRKPLEKGYVYAELAGKEQKPVTSVQDLQINDTLQLYLSDGTISSKIETIAPNKSPKDTL